MTPAEEARYKAGFTIAEAAQRARVSPKYLRAIERNGGCAYSLAMRLARLYRANATVFLTRPLERAETLNELKTRTKSTGKRKAV